MGATDDHISLQEAADELGVHYMTAYRYVRTGRLEAEKAGAVWQVRRVVLEEFARRQGAEAVAGPRSRPERRAELAHRLEDRLTAGDEAGAWAVIEAAMAAGADPEEIYLDVLVPALRTLGERWADDELSIAREHQASAVALRVIGRLGPRFARRGRKRGTVVLGAPPHDLYTLPAAILADLLRGRGFQVVELGANTPAESFVEAAAGAERLVAVGVSSTLHGNEAAVREVIEALRAADADVPIVLGGGAWPDAASAHAIGANAWAHSGRDAVEVFDGLTRRPVRRGAP
ncbi:MAG TPA: B12-binding domain-containing protein [Acidimicrobiales bacterium]|nr:B12-binding domain-containing protein [Acidimicrobiales bacterium]